MSHALKQPLLAVILGSYSVGHAVKSLEYIFLAADIAADVHKITDRVRISDIASPFSVVRFTGRNEFWPT